jgi:hypothetical protein
MPAGTFEGERLVSGMICVFRLLKVWIGGVGALEKLSRFEAPL